MYTNGWRLLLVYTKTEFSREEKKKKNTHTTSFPLNCQLFTAAMCCKMFETIGFACIYGVHNIRFCINSSTQHPEILSATHIAHPSHVIGVHISPPHTHSLKGRSGTHGRPRANARHVRLSPKPSWCVCVWMPGNRCAKDYVSYRIKIVNNPAY